MAKGINFYVQLTPAKPTKVLYRMTYQFDCDSPESAAEALRVASEITHPDKIIVSTMLALPDGVKMVEESHYRIGDYFFAIKVENDKSSLLVTFQPQWLP